METAEIDTPTLTAYQQTLAKLNKHRQLELKKDGLARIAIQLVNKNNGKLNKQKSQLQNLRTVAAGTESPEELRIYIHYQKSRSKESLNTDFANDLLKAMEHMTDILEIRLLVGYICRYGAQFAR